jgi:hypothetical protein
MQPHSGSTRALIGREEQAGAHRFGKVGEETQTRKFLGRMRAAVATDDRVPGPDEGQQIWSDKEAIAHSLYSRRLQVSYQLPSVRMPFSDTIRAVSLSLLLLPDEPQLAPVLEH